MAERAMKNGSRLWVCHRCEMIGSEVEATAHLIARGHACDELSQALSDEIREQWKADHIERAGALIAHARISRAGL